MKGNMDISEIAKTLGKRGGDKTKEKYGTEHFKRLSQKGVEARTKKKEEKN